jgi:hypothetical protein
MYTALIVTHSWLRWVVIVLGLVAVFRAIAGRSSRRAWHAPDATPGRLYTIAFDIQLLIGLGLYLFASPIVEQARGNMAAAMSNSATRFWLVEHAVGMIVAIALAHIGTSRVKKATTDRARFTRAAAFYGASVLITILSTPWPGLPYGRTLFRLG